MSAMNLAILAVEKIEEQPLPVPSVIFPIVALGFFALLATVTWSYRDVANRHAEKAGGTPHAPSH
jgi:hypothetical protein